jgi:enoyl-CoA hydratase/carnithine racemase
VPIHTRLHDHIAVLTFDRPEVRNALDPEHTAIVDAHMEEWESDDDVWVVVVTATGEHAFSTGMDLKARHAANESGPRTHRVTRGKGFASIAGRHFPKPLIAAVNGLAVGGGFELCLACDLVVAEAHAWFALPEARRGLVAASGGLERMARRVPPAVAAFHVMTGAPITAARALELGLVNEVVGRGEALGRALVLAAAVCESSPLAVRLSKRVMRMAMETGQAELDAAVLDAIETVGGSADMREGVAAFVEKRPPRWVGR